MKYSIYDVCLPIEKQSGRGMSAGYLKWEMDRNGIQEYSITDSDCVLCTMQSVESATRLSSLRKKYPGKKIVVGGAVSINPYSVGLHSDVVCVGDGQSFLGILFRDGLDAAIKLNNAWVHGEQRRVEIDQGFPFDMPPIQGEDGAYRLWCGRGCKNKCAFCQTGWGYRYSENPNPKKLMAQARSILSQGKRIAYLSNDLAQHGFYAMLPPTEHGSYSVGFLKKTGLPPARQIRIGIEGVSEQLRLLVMKPISDKDLINCTSWLNKNGKSVRWFMIAGLPSETLSDWQELKTVIQRWKELTPKGVLGVSFTAYCPSPATPLAEFPIDDMYYDYFADFKDWFFGGKGWSNRIKLMNPQMPQARMKKAVLNMGLSESQLREGGHPSPNLRLNYPYQSGCDILKNKFRSRLSA